MSLMGIDEKEAYVRGVREALENAKPPSSFDVTSRKKKPFGLHASSSRRPDSKLHHDEDDDNEDEGEDAMWSAMQLEARKAAEEEPLLASFLFATVLNHESLSVALAFHLANKLKSGTMPSTLLMRLFLDVLNTDPDLIPCMRQDLLAVMERDPACTRLIDALLYFKGFHALQSYRIAHSLSAIQSRSSLAYHLQSQVSKIFQVDIHPRAVIGPGAFIDHATGVVIGETAVIGKNCSMLHHVTLGGSGKFHGDRHPKLGDGVLIGAGATILGNVKIGHGVQIGACSLVLSNIPDYATVVGVPAKMVGRQKAGIPSLTMKHEECIEGRNGSEKSDLGGDSGSKE